MQREMKREMKWLPCTGTALALLLVAPATAQEFEEPPLFDAGEVFHPELLSGPGYEVREAVQNDGCHRATTPVVGESDPIQSLRR